MECIAAGSVGGVSLFLNHLRNEWAVTRLPTRARQWPRGREISICTSPHLAKISRTRHQRRFRVRDLVLAQAQLSRCFINCLHLGGQVDSLTFTLYVNLQ